MTEHRKHIEPSAELIRLYHEGKLDDRTMHALEKQALDDPFLAEALDGFAAAPQAAADEHLQDLHNRLATRVAPVKKVRYLNYRWAAAAAVLMLIATGTLFYINSKQRVMTVAQQKSVPVKKDTPSAVILPPAPEAEVAAGERPALPSPLGSTREAEQVPVADNAARAMDSAALAMSEVRAAKMKEQTEKAAQRFTRKTDTTYFNEPAAPPVARNYEVQKDAARPEQSITQNNLSADTTNQTFIVLRGISSKAAGVDVKSQGRTSMNRFVEGRITDEDHNPLQGVTVIDKANRNGVVTDEKGHFRIQVDSNKTSDLSFDFIGFEQKSLKLGAKENNLAVVMQPSSGALQEVVVSGYGSQKRKKAEGVSAKELNSSTYPAGGFDAFRQYLYDSTRYTEQMNGISGSVIVVFVVEQNGALSQFRLVKKLNNAADQEAIRVIKDGPQWIPANKKKARKVRVEVFFPRREEK